MLIFLQPTQHTVVLTGEADCACARARVWRHMHVCDREACETLTPCLRRNRRTQLLVLTADGVCVSRLIVLREECLLSIAGIFFCVFNSYLKIDITAQRADLSLNQVEMCSYLWEQPAFSSRYLLLPPQTFVLEAAAVRAAICRSETLLTSFGFRLELNSWQLFQ